MGIRGLTTYVNQHSERFHQPFRLHDCYLVIDGCSLACQLYIRSRCNSAFGGDYDKFAQTVEEFFSLLIKCNVTPIVIIDGGYEARKLKTVSQRMKSKLHNAKVCNPVNQNTASVFPLLMMESFKQTLKQLNVKFAQTDFEADYEIAATGRYLNCPVLSYDSDFYIFDVKYISFATLNLSPSKMKCDESVKYFLNCRIYVVQHLIDSFGGLDKSLLPLIATILGNDYVPAYIFKKIYNHVKLSKSKKISHQQKRIAAIFEWLRNETLESAVRKILNHLRKDHRKFVQSQIELSISGYSRGQSNLISFFGWESSDSDQQATDTAAVFNFGDDLNSEEDSSEESVTSEAESQDEDNSDDNITGQINEGFKVPEPTPWTDSNFPEWVRDKFRKGELPSFVSDIYHLHFYFCQPQVEDFTWQDSHTLSFPILQVNTGLLFGNCQDHCSECKNCSIICYTRISGSKHQRLELLPVTSLQCLAPFPAISNLIAVPKSVKKLVLYTALGITDSKDMDVIESFRGEWMLFVLALVYLARNPSSSITNCHLHALVMGMLLLGVVDKKLGRIRHKKDVLRRTTNNPCNKPCSLKSNLEVSSDFARIPEDILSTVSESECLNVVESLVQFHCVDAKLRSSPRQFSPNIVHIFAQLQACLLQIMALNSLLDSPLPECLISETFSGTTAYMAYINFNKRKNVGSYVQSLLTSSPNLFHIYKAILDKFLYLLPSIPVLLRKGKRKSKKRQFVDSALSDVDSENVADSKQEESPIDLNNKFSVLYAP